MNTMQTAEKKENSKDEYNAAKTKENSKDEYNVNSWDKRKL